MLPYFPMHQRWAWVRIKMLPSLMAGEAFVWTIGVGDSPAPAAPLSIRRDPSHSIATGGRLQERSPSHQPHAIPAMVRRGPRRSEIVKAVGSGGVPASWSK